jgi:hypothetical protein
LASRSALYAPAGAQVVLARLLFKPIITAQVVGTLKQDHLYDAFSSVTVGIESGTQGSNPAPSSAEY